MHKNLIRNGGHRSTHHTHPLETVQKRYLTIVLQCSIRTTNSSTLLSFSLVCVILQLNGKSSLQSPSLGSQFSSSSKVNPLHKSHSFHHTHSLLWHSPKVLFFFIQNKHEPQGWYCWPSQRWQVHSLQCRCKPLSLSLSGVFLKMKFFFFRGNSIRDTIGEVPFLQIFELFLVFHVVMD